MAGSNLKVRRVAKYIIQVIVLRCLHENEVELYLENHKRYGGET